MKGVVITIEPTLERPAMSLFAPEVDALPELGVAGEMVSMARQVYVWTGKWERFGDPCPIDFFTE